MRKTFIAVLVGIALIIGVIQLVDSKPSFMTAFNDRYPNSLLKGNCIVCHIGNPSTDDGKKLNVYGNAYKKNDKDLPAIEGLDSDSDGYSNKVEIDAGTLPGDPKSSPATLPPSNDGAALYATYCASCHNPLATSTKKGRTAAQIPAAFSISDMSGLKNLTQAQVDAIAAALGAQPPDTTAPAVTGFSIIPATSASLTVPIASLTATDAVGVTAYIITESSSKPLASDPWVAVTSTTSYSTTSASYSAATPGAKTLYAWARDAAGNISTSRSASVTITLADTAAPTVTAFSIPPTSSSLTVSGISMTATDAVGVTACIITESSSKPLASDPWIAVTSTTSYSTTSASYSAATPGAKTLYAWARDAAGNISTSRSASVTITATIDGAALYGTNCASCHNPLATSTKKGRSANQIQLAINNNTGGMGSSSLRGLTAAQIDAIAAALTVAAPVLTTVNVTPPTASINPGATRQLTASPLDQNGAAFAGATIAWSSNNGPVATVNATTGLVTGVSVGTATITATATSGATTKTGTSVITVTAAAPVLTTVNVTPPTASINPGATRQLTASPLDQNGAAFAGATIAWSSNNGPVATVNATTGLVTGVSVGTATITATATSGATTKTGTSVITVTAATPPDGAALYGTNCASCHNPLATSTKKGRSGNPDPDRHQ